ncbi:hypothetical protein [Mycobacterium sp. 155]|uniref:hypothetical protein n=1 Tax=Mycobacterium sp. 155 TaxID=1157943 RepID=UPI0004771D9E|nr:hypothetical protein [Mycobacterium sp. 155]
MNDKQYAEMFKYMQSGFEAVHAQNTEMRSRLELLTGKVNELDAKVDHVEERLTARIDKIDSRMGRVEERLDEIVDSQNEILNAIGQRFDESDNLHEQHGQQIKQLADHSGLTLAA